MFDSVLNMPLQVTYFASVKSQRKICPGDLHGFEYIKFKYPPWNTRFFISNIISNTRLKLAKNYAKAKQQSVAELLTNMSKNKFVCFNERLYD